MCIVQGGCGIAFRGLTVVAGSLDGVASFYFTSHSSLPAQTHIPLKSRLGVAEVVAAIVQYIMCARLVAPSVGSVDLHGCYI